MFTGLSPLLLMGLSLLPISAEKEKRFSPYANPYVPYWSGKVLDVFENNEVLISLGTKQGIRKGMEMDVYRSKPEPIYIGRVELVAVGAKHAMGRFRDNIGQPKQVRENDLAFVVYEMRLGPIPKLPRFPELPRLPLWQQRGGAILDPEGLLKKN